MGFQYTCMLFHVSEYECILESFVLNHTLNYHHYDLGLHETDH